MFGVWGLGVWLVGWWVVRTHTCLKFTHYIPYDAILVAKGCKFDFCVAACVRAL